MLNYQDLPRLPSEQCRQRYETAKRVVGERVLVRLVAFVLFALGASRRSIAEELGLAKPTLTSLTQRVLRDGLPAFEDRRRRSSTFLQPAPHGSRLETKLIAEPDRVVVAFNDEARVELSRDNPVQCRTVLLTMLEAGLLCTGEVAAALDLSTERVRQLRTTLIENDAGALVDQRRGRQQDLLVTPEVKAEVIQQFVLNLQTGVSTSSRQLAQDLSARCNVELAERTLRMHVSRLGLPQLRASMPRLLAAVKKTPEPADAGRQSSCTDQE